MMDKMTEKGTPAACPVSGRCGGCRDTGIPYETQLRNKQKMMEKLLGGFGPLEPVIGMEDPFRYRNKVHHVFARDKKGNVLAGCYEARSHRVVDIKDCLIEDRKCQEIILTIRSMLRSFRILIYDEDRGTGLLRHVLVRRGFQTGEIMVVLVLSSPILPGKNNFVKALLKAHPEITTIVININDEDTSMVLGKTDKTIYGPGFIKDRLCGCTFRISPQSFYQVNPVQTEVLYDTAVKYADLQSGEKLIDAYCGIGTIGLTAAKRVPGCLVTGVELNADAVRDAKMNARENRIGNARFITGDAGRYMEAMADAGESADVVFMDPPRSGSTEQFMKAVVRIAPSRVVYISCGPETLKRDLGYFTKHGYRVRRMQPVDMFPFTAEHVETVVLLTRE